MDRQGELLMKSLIILVTFAICSSVFADLIVPLVQGVECTTVDSDGQGKPDLKKFNANLKRRSQNSSVELASVSVTPVGDKFLVCTTAKATAPKK